MTKEEAIKAIKTHCYFANLVPVGKEALDMAIEVLEKQPCEDAVSRKAVDHLCFEFLRANSDDNIAFYEHFRGLPPVTPTRKPGKWKLVQVGKRVDLCCANCGAVRIEEVAYNYTIDQLNKFFKEDYKELLKHPDMSYCPCCGIKMENEDI